MPIRNRQTDACPGVLTVHQAADGGVARIRVPGGQLSAEAFRVIADGAAELGDGTIELTSRANLQVRGLADGAALGERLADVGLLPSATHERVRNIMASPLTGRDRRADARPLVSALDAGLLADPDLAKLPGRFLFAVDDGREDVAWSGADVAILGEDAILLGGVDSGLRGDPVPLALACAREFLALRTDEWRLAELADGPRRIAARVGDPVPPSLRGTPVTRGPLGRVDQVDGLVSLVAGAPLGRLDRAQAAALAGADLVVTPWRSVVVADLPPDRVALVADRLRAAGLLLDPSDPLARVTACTGRPGCAKALADVRADAAPLPGVDLPVHWSGCARRCGRPRGEVVDVVATESGYTTESATQAPRVGHSRTPNPPPTHPESATERLPPLGNGQLDPRERPTRPTRVADSAYASGQLDLRGYVRDGGEIYRRSFATIRAEADLAGLPPDVERVAVRMIHACGMVDLVDDLAYSPDVVASARAALLAGAPVLCDAAMIASGVTRRRLPAGNDIVCTLTDPRVPSLASSLGTTRSAAALELWGEALDGAVVAIGNAPTALFRLLELLDTGAPRPAAILGLPVGFVGAAESKVELARHGAGVPHLVVHGRRGGSAMAVAAVNAIASEAE